MYLFTRAVAPRVRSPRRVDGLVGQDDREGQRHRRGRRVPLDHRVLTRPAHAVVDRGDREPHPDVEPQRQARSPTAATSSSSTRARSTPAARPSTTRSCGSSTLDPDGASATPQFASVVQAVLAPGHAVTGVELGVEIAAAGQGDHRPARRRSGRASRAPTAASAGSRSTTRWTRSRRPTRPSRRTPTSPRSSTPRRRTAYLPGASTQTLHRKIA